MLRLAAKLVAFFWRREDASEEKDRSSGQELVEGARGENGAPCRHLSLHRALQGAQNAGWERIRPRMTGTEVQACARPGFRWS